MPETLTATLQRKDTMRTPHPYLNSRDLDLPVGVFGILEAAVQKGTTLTRGEFESALEQSLPPGPRAAYTGARDARRSGLGLHTTTHGAIAPGDTHMTPSPSVSPQAQQLVASMAMPLTVSEREAARQLGMSDADFHAARNESIALQLPGGSIGAAGLTADELKICAVLGLEPSAFACEKARRG